MYLDTFHSGGVDSLIYEWSSIDCLNEQNLQVLALRICPNGFERKFSPFIHDIIRLTTERIYRGFHSYPRGWRGELFWLRVRLENWNSVVSHRDR